MFRHALSRVVAQKGACHLVQGGSGGGSAIGRVVAVAAVCHDRPVHSLAHVLTQAAGGHDDNHTHAAPGPRFNYFTSFVAPGSGTASDKASHGIVRFVTADAGSKDGVCQVAGIEVPPKQVFMLPDADRTNSVVAHVNLGAADKVTASTLRKATASALQALSGVKREHVTVETPSDVGGDKLDADTVVGVVAQAAMLSSYNFDLHVTEEASKPHAFKSLDIDVEPSQASLVERTRVLCDATALARDLANERGDVAHPEFMALAAEQVSELSDNCSLHVLEYDELRDQGLNLLASVGQGAERTTHQPRLVVMPYIGNPTQAHDRVALVGKGITFDSGGLNLKPTGFMETMHADMGGAAAVLGAMYAIIRLKLPINVVAAIPLAENCIGPNAYKPHGIVKSYKGLTVEVGNTDAEGRLALADAMSFVQHHHKPHTVIDAATLTGACVVALGDKVAGLFSNNDDLAAALTKAGDVRHERAWRLPITEEHTEELASKFADTRSIGAGRYGGACTAAAFLQKFVEDDVAWAHLDIAGPAMAPGDGTKESCPGFGAQLLAEYLVSLAKTE